VFSITSTGSFGKTKSYLEQMTKLNVAQILERSGKAGVVALASATPVESGLAANSWTYTVESGIGTAKIVWHNTDIESGFPVALMLQFGYGTGTGGFVAGRDYINPAIEPIFRKIQSDVWKAVTS
jgi:hypothetical protein